MTQFTKQAAGDTWVLRDAGGSQIGRVWATAHIDRLLRDGDLAEEIAAALALAGAARRTAVRDAVDAWIAKGGRGIDLSGLTLSALNDGGIEDGNTHIYVGAQEIGYLSGTAANGVTWDQPRVARFTRLAEELFAAGVRTADLDAAVARFSADGGLA